MRYVPSRSWFRFSTRTLLALIAVVAIVLSQQARWVRQRREFLKIDGVYDASDQRRLPRAPGILPLFGETGVYLLLVSEDFDVLEERARELFPEARVVQEFSFGGVTFTR